MFPALLRLQPTAGGYSANFEDSSSTSVIYPPCASQEERFVANACPKVGFATMTAQTKRSRSQRFTGRELAIAVFRRGCLHTGDSVQVQVLVQDVNGGEADVPAGHQLGHVFSTLIGQ